MCRKGWKTYYDAPLLADADSMGDFLYFEDEVHPRFELPNATRRYPRDAGFRIKHLTLHIEVDLEKRSISGRAIYEIGRISGVRDSTISLDAREMNVRSVKWDGKQLEFTHLDDVLSFKPGRSTDGTVEINYSSRPESGIYFVYTGADKTGTPQQAWSQGEDEHSRYWFPCFDSPNMMFTTDFHITVKSGLTAVSNGRLVGKSEDKMKKRMTFHWREEVPHSSYLNSLVVGKFSLVEDSYGRLPVQYYVQKGREDEARRSFGKTPDMLKFFEKIIGVKYPYEKYAQVAVSDFIWGGMENVSATTLTDETLHDERAEKDFPSHPLVAHELAHQWWGDLVTTKDWSNIWLNEGFATYFDAQFRQNDSGQDEFEYHLDWLMKVYFAEDEKSYRRPIVQRSYYVAGELFDRTTYQKGAIVLHMLRMSLGDTLFYKAINRYCTDNRSKNVETSDLIKAIEQSTGRNMQSFFDQWVFSAGYPEFDLKYSYNQKEKQVEIGIIQKQKTDSLTPLFDVDLEFSVYMPDGKRRQEIARVRSKESRLTFNVGERPAFVSADPHNSLLKKMDYERPLEDVIKQLSEGTPFEKVQAARELSRKSRESVVEALREELSKNNFWSVHAECADALGKLNRKDALDALLHAKVADSRARKTLVRAIGSYRESTTAKHLERFLDDKSYAVQAEAVTALSLLQNFNARKSLSRALRMESHQDVVRKAALAAFGDTGTKDDIENLKVYTTSKYRSRVRSAAIAAIALLGREDRKTRRYVYNELRSDNLIYRGGVIHACVLTESSEAIPELESMLNRERDGRLKRNAYDAIEAIRKKLTKSAELKSISREIAGIRGDIRALRHSVEALEQRLKKR